MAFPAPRQDAPKGAPGIQDSIQRIHFTCGLGHARNPQLLWCCCSFATRAPGRILFLLAERSMNYDTLDNEELLFVALDAVNGARYGEAIMLVRMLLGRDPKNANAQYLLSAQHAQIGMYERAEDGFRTLLALAPGFSIARFQLGQLLLMKNASTEAKDALSPLAGNRDAIGAYARALCAVADDDADMATREIQAGLQLPQSVPTLASDMQALLARLSSSGDRPRIPVEEPYASETEPSLSAPMFMTSYGRGL
jgi:tetratricopeptide (TPR) repeat protein